MTTHEVLSSLLLVIAGGYAIYLAWFLKGAIHRRGRGRTSRRPTTYH